MCPQNAGNAISETQNSNISGGACPRSPLQLCRHYGLPLNKILTTPSLLVFIINLHIPLCSMQIMQCFLCCQWNTGISSEQSEMNLILF